MFSKIYILFNAQAFNDMNFFFCAINFTNKLNFCKGFNSLPVILQVLPQNKYLSDLRRFLKINVHYPQKYLNIRFFLLSWTSYILEIIPRKLGWFDKFNLMKMLLNWSEWPGFRVSFQSNLVVCTQHQLNNVAVV